MRYVFGIFPTPHDVTTSLLALEAEPFLGIIIRGSQLRACVEMATEQAVRLTGGLMTVGRLLDGDPVFVTTSDVARTLRRDPSPDLAAAFRNVWGPQGDWLVERIQDGACVLFAPTVTEDDENRISLLLLRLPITSIMVHEATSAPSL